MTWATKHDNPQNGWIVDFDFHDNDEDDGGDDAFFGISDFGSVGVFDEKGDAVCFVVSLPFDHAKMKRIARLIAAAPDMYAALKELAECSRYWSEYDVPLGIHDRIMAALAKAGGQ